MSDQAAATDSADRKALERFVVDNDDLLELESRIGKFNIFDALGITRVEIRHSNFLAFILDPAESHGQGQLFLKALLMDLLKEAPPELRPLSPIDLDGIDLRGVEVNREWRNIDLLITCKEPRFAVVIENKVDSKEHSDQLIRYRATMDASDYRELPALYVYLTPDGEPPSEQSWAAYSYEKVHSALTRIRRTCEQAIGEDVLVFLDHYLNLLGTRFMDNKELDELCQRIYKNHRQAIELIINRGRPVSGLLGEVAAVLKGDDRWEVDPQGPRPRVIVFRPKTWKDWLPPLGRSGASGPTWWVYVVIHLLDDGTLLGHSVDVAPMTDAQKRIDIVTRLLDECQKVGFERPRSKVLPVANNYSRLSAFQRIAKIKEQQEIEPEAIRKAVEKALADLYPKLQKLEAFLRTAV